MFEEEKKDNLLIPSGFRIIGTLLKDSSSGRVKQRRRRGALLAGTRRPQQQRE